jgi:hypothetical protein
LVANHAGLGVLESRGISAGQPSDLLVISRVYSLRSVIGMIRVYADPDPFYARGTFLCRIDELGSSLASMEGFFFFGYFVRIECSELCP